MTERPRYNRLVNEEYANGGFAGDEPLDQQTSPKLPGNPYLTALSSGAAIALVIGTVLWATRAEVRLESGTVIELEWIGAVAFWIGMGLLIGWLTASAACWQLQQSPTKRQPGEH